MTESNQVVQLTAMGGVPPYAWSIIDPNLGSLSNLDKSAVNYTRKGGAVGQNIVELKDNSQNPGNRHHRAGIGQNQKKYVVPKLRLKSLSS